MAKRRKDKNGRVLQQGESQRADSMYMFRYTDQFKKRQCIYAKTLQELREKEKEIAAMDFLHADKIANTSLTVINLIDRYRNLSMTKRQSTQRNYTVARNFIARYPIGDTLATKLKPGDFKMWLVQLYNEGYAASTVRNMGRIVKIAYNSAVEDGIILKSPANIKLDFLPSSKKREALTEKEQLNFLEFLRSDKNFTCYLDLTIVLMGTGMRVAEFAGLTINDIDFKTKSIKISRQLCGYSKDKLYVERPKTDRGERMLPMDDNVCEAMRNIVDRTLRVEEPMIIDGISGFLMPFRRGQIRQPSAYADIYSKICEQYNRVHDEHIKVTPHILRHTFCTNMAHKGMSIPSLQYLMGHATSATTLQTYTHVNMNKALEEFSQIA